MCEGGGKLEGTHGGIQQQHNKKSSALYNNTTHRPSLSRRVNVCGTILEIRELHKLGEALICFCLSQIWISSQEVSWLDNLCWSHCLCPTNEWSFNPEGSGWVCSITPLTLTACFRYYNSKPCHLWLSVSWLTRRFLTSSPRSISVISLHLTSAMFHSNTLQHIFILVMFPYGRASRKRRR